MSSGRRPAARRRRRRRRRGRSARGPGPTPSRWPASRRRKGPSRPAAPDAEADATGPKGEDRAAVNGSEAAQAPDRSESSLRGRQSSGTRSARLQITQLNSCKREDNKTMAIVRSRSSDSQPGGRRADRASLPRPRRPDPAADPRPAAPPRGGLGRGDHRGARHLPAERLQASRGAAGRGLRRPPQAGDELALPDRRPGGARALRRLCDAMETQLTELEAVLAARESWCRCSPLGAPATARSPMASPSEAGSAASAPRSPRPPLRIPDQGAFVNQRFANSPCPQVTVRDRSL